MKFSRALSLAFLICLASTGLVHAQVWSSVLSSSRAIDWSNAGVVGGIPSAGWTQCGSTIAAYSGSAANINSAIAGCGANHYVLLGPGTFNLNSGIDFAGKSNVVLRGSGANTTFLVFTGDTSCAGAFATICLAAGSSSDYFGDARMQPGGSNAATWTSGYLKGTTQIVLNNIGSSGISVGQYIHLDQAEDTSTNSGFFSCENTSASPPCSAEGGKGDPGRVVGGVARQQIQIVAVTGCSPSCTNGATFTISPGLYAPNYAAAYSPGAWWPSSTISNSGIEDLSLDATNAGSQKNIEIYNAHNVWVKGTRQIRTCTCNRSIIQMHAAAHVTIQNNYFYGTSGHSQNYGVESYITSDALVLNNIFQHVVSPMMVHSNTGSVYAFNYAMNDTYDDGNLPLYHYLSNAIAGHSGGVMYNLFEGNIGPGIGADAIHGNQIMNTVFRNTWLGSDPNRIDATVAIDFESWNRFWNLIGNVLGTPGFSSSYTGSKKAIFNLGGGRSAVPDDPLVATTMMRWGNYDVVNAAVLWNTGEVPSGISAYPNFVPSTQTLPASLFLSGRPGWWPTSKAWPIIGPDVSGGNVAGYAGHANTNPAQDCYASVMNGPADGSGPVLSFNPANCYTANPAPMAPTNLRIVP